MPQSQLAHTAKALVAPAKGILALDETPGTLTSRFKTLNIESTPESRRDYRELFFRTPGISDWIGGAILNEETLRQQAADGSPMVKLVESVGVMPGVKVDRGIQPLAGAPDEGVTEGLDGLRARLREFRELCVRFVKWRAVIKIGAGIPTQYCIDVNAHALARYAALAQEAGLVPMVEAEVLLDGDHDIDRCGAVTEQTLRSVFAQLAVQRVQLEGMVLKPNMVVSAKDTANRAGPPEVARWTVNSLMRTVPAAVPGICFLSGGQTDGEATENLQAIVSYGAGVGAPWQLSFSYARALQGAPMKAWGGHPRNVQKAQQVFRGRAQAVSAARQGDYHGPHPSPLPGGRGEQ